MPVISQEQKNKALEFFICAQKRLAKELEKVDGSAHFDFKNWNHKEGGGGTIGVMRGDVVEKTGVNISAVSGKSYPNIEKEYKNKPFFAAGLSTITHMKNPHAPIGHMNVRMIDLGDKFWFGGGADLTPCFEYAEDRKEFHAFLEKACNNYDVGSYEKFSKWCDEYFYISHRKKVRGVGGIFFDYLEGDFEKLFSFIKNVFDAYTSVFPRILEKRKNMLYDEKQKDQQLHWRGHYAEFNLIYDRGTRFGILSGGNPEAIFVSLPPEVKW
jgi:coproporphyrinogen III oxidase